MFKAPVYFFIFLCLSISSTGLSQKTSKELENSKLDLSEYELKFITDTIYSRHLGSFTDNNIIFYNQNESILCTKEDIKPYLNITSHRDQLCQIDNKTYYYTIDQNKNIQIELDKPIQLNLQDLKKQNRNCLRIDYPRIIYSVNDSVFIDNFENPGKKFIIRSSTVLRLNDKYAWIPSKGKNFIYHIESNTLIQEPDKMPYYGARDFTNNYALPYYEKTDTTSYILVVYDIDFNPLVNYAQGYRQYCANSKLLLLFSKNRPTLGICEGKIHTLEYQIQSAKTIPSTDLILLTNYEGKVGVINSKMELVQPFEFDKCWDKPYTIPHFILKTDSRAILVDGNGQKMLNDEYQNIDFLNEERLKVVNEKGFAIIDLNEKFIIPFQKGKNKLFSISKTGTTKTIHAIGYHRTTEIYSYEGELIATIKDKEITEEEKLKFYYSKKLIKLQGLSLDDVRKINPSMLWSGSKKIDNKYYRALINFNGEVVVDWSNYVFHPLLNNRFLYKTQDQKLGIFEYSKQK